MTSNAVPCGALVITQVSEKSTFGATTSKVETDGVARLYQVKGPKRLRITVADIAWSNGERDVRTTDRHTSSPRFDRLVHGLRIGVHVAPDGLLRIDLRQARMTSELWSQAKQASLLELSDVAGFDVDAMLRAHGAVAVATRGQLIGDTSTHRNKICALFPPSGSLVPVVAYAATRVLPVQNRHGLAA